MKEYFADDFHIVNVKPKPLMVLRPKLAGSNGMNVDLTLVAFKTETCHHCKVLDGVYSELAKKIEGVNFDYIFLNKKNNMVVAQNSGQTPFGITGVPRLILFVNGVAYAMFPPGVQRDFNNIVKFLTQQINGDKESLRRFTGFIRSLPELANGAKQGSGMGSAARAAPKSEAEIAAMKLANEATGTPMYKSGDEFCNGMYTVVCDDSSCQLTYDQMCKMNPSV